MKIYTLFHDFLLLIHFQALFKDLLKKARIFHNLYDITKPAKNSHAFYNFYLMPSVLDLFPGNCQSQREKGPCTLD